MIAPQSTYCILKQVQCICPLSWSVHCNFTGEGKCNERGWACTPHPHQPGLILPSSLNVRQKAAVATLCTLWAAYRGEHELSPICLTGLHCFKIHEIPRHLKILHFRKKEKGIVISTLLAIFCQNLRLGWSRKWNFLLPRKS
jgi:hypothetical protein